MDLLFWLWLPSFARTGKLLEQLRSGQVSSNEQFGCLTGLVAFGFFIMFMPSGCVALVDLKYWLAGIVMLGVYGCYYVNGGNNGKDFLLRYLVLTMHIFVRLFVAAMIALFGAMFYFLIQGQQDLPSFYAKTSDTAWNYLCLGNGWVAIAIAAILQFLLMLFFRYLVNGKKLA